MNTVEMWVKAQNTGCTYKCPKHKMLYSKSVGLVEDDEYNYNIYLDDFASGTTLEELMSFEWEIANEFMTAEEAEKKYNIKIIKTNI